jgi:hypothetical protein
MKTTIELPDDLAREAEAAAAFAGQSLPDLVAQGLRLLLAHPELGHQAQGGASEETRARAGVARPDPTAWDRLCAAWESPFPGLTAMEMLDEFRGPVELPPGKP